MQLNSDITRDLQIQLLFIILCQEKFVLFLGASKLIRISNYGYKSDILAAILDIFVFLSIFFTGQLFLCFRKRIASKLWLDNYKSEQPNEPTYGTSLSQNETAFAVWLFFHLGCALSLKSIW